jgi:Ca2+-binding RTX toxin-like protein
MGTYTGTALDEEISPSTVSPSVTVSGTPKPSSAADTINGLAGDDVLNGGGGDDDVWDGSQVGDDGYATSTNTGNVIHGNAGNDRVHISVAETRGDNPVTNTAYGDEGDDEVSLFFGSNEGAYATVSPSGTITLHGGTGNDGLWVNSLWWNVNMAGTTAYLYGEDGDDWLDATHSDPNMDYDFYPGNNPDVLDGGLGNDTYLVLEPRDKVVEHAGEGYDKITAYKTSYTLPANVEALEMRAHYAWGEDAYSGTGNELDNVITTEQYFSDPINYSLHGLGGNDTISGSPLGNDTLYGDLGNDTISGQDGNDQIYGGRSADDPADGPDTIYADAGNDNVWAGGGNDLVYGGSGDDNLYAQSGNDTIRGGGGNDRVYGGTGTDTLYGEDGVDNVRGGGGADRCDGGTGNDRYSYETVSDSAPGTTNRDVILAFANVGATAGDQIDLAAIDANTGIGGNQAFTSLIVGGAFTATQQLRVAASGADTILYGNTDANLSTAEVQILILGVAPGAFNLGLDFIA